MASKRDVRMSESAWARGWADTKQGLADWRFWAAEVFGGGFVAVYYDPVLALVFVLGLAVALWLGATVSAPVRQRDEARTALEARLARSLEFTWRQNDNKFLETTKRKGVKNSSMLVGRVAVKNRSYTESIRGVDVSLINYKIDGESRFTSIDRHLRNNSTGQQKTDLHARREANFNLFYVMDNDPLLRLGLFIDGDSIPLSQGKYALKVTASADDMGREDAFFFLDFSGFDNIEFRPWEPGATSHDDAGSPPATPDGQSEPLTH
jgi:hypothetical protein